MQFPDKKEHSKHVTLAVSFTALKYKCWKSFEQLIIEKRLLYPELDWVLLFIIVILVPNSWFIELS